MTKTQPGVNVLLNSIISIKKNTDKDICVCLQLELSGKVKLPTNVLVFFVLVKILVWTWQKFFVFVARPLCLREEKRLEHYTNMVHFIWRHSHKNPQTEEEEKGIFSHEKELILSGKSRVKINLEGKKACPKATYHMKGCMKYTSRELYLKLSRL